MAVPSKTECASSGGGVGWGYSGWGGVAAVITMAWIRRSRQHRYARRDAGASRIGARALPCDLDPSYAAASHAHRKRRPPSPYPARKQGGGVMTKLRARCHIPSLVLLVGIGCVLVFTSSGRAQGPVLPPELDKVRTALEKYQDPYVAVRDGY